MSSFSNCTGASTSVNKDGMMFANVEICVTYHKTLLLLCPSLTLLNYFV